jgi:hypothetical protein
MAQVVWEDQKSILQPGRERTGLPQGGGSEPKRKGALVLIQGHHIREDRLAVERRFASFHPLDVDTDDTKGGVILVTSDEERTTRTWKAREINDEARTSFAKGFFVNDGLGQFRIPGEHVLLPRVPPYVSEVMAVLVLVTRGETSLFEGTELVSQGVMKTRERNPHKIITNGQVRDGF